LAASVASTARVPIVTPNGAAGIKEFARASALGSSRSAMTIDVSDGVFRDASAAAAPISPAPRNRTRIDNTLANRTGNRLYTKITTVVTSRRLGLSWEGKGRAGRNIGEGWTMSDPTASAVQADRSNKSGAGKTSLAVLALVGLLFAYNLGLNITPIINGLWTERLGLAPSQAGLVISAQFALMAVSTMLTARLLQKLNIRRAAMSSAAAVGVADVATGYAQTPALLALCFGTAGIGIGVQMACVAALLSRHENAERLYAIAVVAASFIIAALTIVFASVAPGLSV